MSKKSKKKNRSNRTKKGMRGKFSVTKATRKPKKIKKQKKKDSTILERYLSLKGKGVPSTTVKRKKFMDAEELRSLLPEGIKGNITESTVKYANELVAAVEDPELARETIITFSEVLKDRSHSPYNFMKATLYVTLVSNGYKKRRAYSRVFPDKLKKLKKDKRNSSYIATVVNAYHKSKLVQSIMAQTIAPIHVLYSGVFHKAIKKQVELLDAHSEIVQQKAASSLMDTLAPPDIVAEEAEKNTGKAIDIVGTILEATMELAEKQQQAIKDGRITAKELLGAEIIPKETIVSEQ